MLTVSRREILLQHLDRGIWSQHYKFLVNWVASPVAPRETGTSWQKVFSGIPRFLVCALDVTNVSYAPLVVHQRTILDSMGNDAQSNMCTRMRPTCFARAYTYQKCAKSMLLHTAVGNLQLADCTILKWRCASGHMSTGCARAKETHETTASAHTHVFCAAVRLKHAAHPH